MSNNTSPQSVSLTVEDALKRALTHHQAGQFQDAERLYQAILQAQPDHPAANHNVGILALQFKQPVAGLPYFKKALEANPNEAQYWFSYIDALILAGQSEAAHNVLLQGQQRGLKGDAIALLTNRLKGTPPVSSVDISSQQAPDQPLQQELNTLISLFQTNQYAETEQLARQLTIRFPLHGFGWKILGAVHGQLGRHTEALAPMRQAVTLSPQDASAHNNLGNVLLALGKLDEAKASFQQALTINPRFAVAHYNLGNAFKDMRKLGEAEASYQRAIEIEPAYADAHNNLGSIFGQIGKVDEAEASYRQALHINPNLVSAHNNLGGVLIDSERFEEAQVAYSRALALDPSHCEALIGLGNVLGLAGKLEAAAVHFKHYLEIDPEDTLGARLLLARLGLEPVPARASDAHLNKLYIERSRNWDVGNSYRGHTLVVQSVKDILPRDDLRILDAGCGTGLVGELLRDHAIKLIGVDMSAAMLERAKEKAIYDQLDHGDLVAFMANSPGSFDVITCAATLIHFGDLTPAFEAAASALEDGGIFVFTLFPNDNDDSRDEVVIAPNSELANGGCYAHSSAYVRGVVA